MIIRAHYDTDLFEGDSDSHLYDTRASLRAFSGQLLAALEARFPEADVRVTYDTRTGGDSSLCVCDDEGNEAYFNDDARAVMDEVFSGDWRVLRDDEEAV